MFLIIKQKLLFTPFTSIHRL